MRESTTKPKMKSDSPSKVRLSTDQDMEENSSNDSISPADKNNRTKFWRFGEKRSSKTDRKSTKSSESSFHREPQVTLSASATPRASRPNPGSTSSKTPPPKPRKQPSRFSLRRLFYGNPLLAQPFLQATTTLGTNLPGPSGSSRSQRKSQKAPQASSSVKNFDDRHSETRSVVRDNLSSCSSVPGGATASNIRECSLCLSEFTPEQFPVLRNCSHSFCIECLQTYVRIEVQEGRVNLRCPQCTEYLHPNDIETLIGDKTSNLMSLYESLMLRRILAVDPDTRWCPGPNCSYAVIAQGCATCPKLDCERPGCGYSFCYHCKAEWHPNQTCDSARVKRNPSQQPIPKNLGSSSGNFSAESNIAGAAGGSMSEIKVCPRCNVLIVKMDDGSCNHMTCAVCGAEFCWLCMKEISDLHYLSPSGCTFWGKKPWSRKKKLLWQLGTIIGAPVGIALVACISIPAMIIGIPSWVGRKIHDRYKTDNKHKRNLAVFGGVVASLVMSPAAAVLAVSIGVPVLLCYVYAVVPIALCRSDGCGVSTSENGGVRIDIDEDEPYRPVVSEASSILNARGIITNPSIGEMSLGASMSLGSGCHLERDETESGTREQDRESASNTAIAGTSLTGSLASSYYSAFPGHSGGAGTGIGHFAGGGVLGASHLNRLEVGADVHTARKKFSLSSERLSETVSLSERSATVSLAEEGGGNSAAASTRALAGSLLAYKLDCQSVSSCRTTGGEICETNPAGGDDTSLRSLPMVSIHQGSTSTQIILSGQSHISNQMNSSNSQPRSMSPVSCQSGDDLGYSISGRKSTRSRRAHLDKQLSENSSLLSGDDAISERVRFDENVSFIEDVSVASLLTPANTVDTAEGVLHAAEIQLSRISKTPKLETPSLPEETPEELAQVISPEPQHRPCLSDQDTPSSPEHDEHVTLLSIGECDKSTKD